MEIIKGANLAVRFLLELWAFAALGYWGFQTGSGTVAKAGLGIGAPLVAIVAWGTMVAPKATIEVSPAIRLLVELAVFGSAVAALIATGRLRLALALAVAYAVNRILLAVWGQ